MKRQSGQAFIELLVLLAIAGVGTMKAAHLGLSLMSEIIVEDSLESALICKFQRRTDCIPILRSKLVGASFREVKISDRSSNDSARIRVEWEATFGKVNTLENEMRLDLSAKELE